MKIVIIGGVAGGASAAARLRRLDEKAEIVLLEKGPFISFANCGLPYYIGGEIKQQSALTLQTPESFNARFNVSVRVFSEAMKIDRAARIISVKNLETGEICEESYDRLILATGAEPINFAPGDRVFTLRSIPDALRIRACADSLKDRENKSAVIVGGGYIGVEMAENLVRAGLHVTIVEMADHLIAPLDFDTASDVHHYIEAKGVKLYLGVGVKEIHQGERLTLKLSEGELTADMVIMAVGVRPDSRLAAEAGLQVNARRGIVVNAHMQTSDEHIFAVGDMAQTVDPLTGAAVMIPLAGPANRQGRIAADNICGIKSAYEGTQGSAILKIFDMTVAATGLNERAAAMAKLDYDKAYLYAGNHAGYYPGAENMSMKVLFERETGRILGAQIVGFQGVDKRCDVLATAIRLGATAKDLTKLELCYAPPFGSAKDPVNMAGFVIENLLNGLVSQIHWPEVEALPRDGSVQLLDVRTEAEHARASVPGFINIPLNELRQRLSELDPKKPVVVHCFSGLRSYVACRILTGRGFACKNIAGGYRLYETVRRA